MKPARKDAEMKRFSDGKRYYGRYNGTEVGKCTKCLRDDYRKCRTFWFISVTSTSRSRGLIKVTVFDDEP
jgi:hypothetical protein